MTIQWNDSLSVKVAEIDAQHRRLIGLITSLEEAMTKGQGKQVLGSVLTELVQYTKDHFATEERLMATHGYADAAGHRQKHIALTTQVWELKVKYDAGQAALSIPTMNFLSNWLSDHILNQDKKFGAFLNSKGVR